jgi:DNA (cytosine-5)-methyltransferase 1
VNQLVLSLFPGVGLLDAAFEAEGFTVVRGPDRIWGGDVRNFHPPADRFDGIIGGPPCQAFSGLGNLMRARGGNPLNLIPEYERVVREARPHWFVMENVPTAPVPTPEGYGTASIHLNNQQLGEEQDRRRRFTMGLLGGLAPRGFWVDVDPLLPFRRSATVTAAHAGARGTAQDPTPRYKIQHYTVAEALRLQGCPPDFFGPRSPFRKDAQLKMLAEGVPLPMGRAVARAARKALGLPIVGEAVGA